MTTPNLISDILLQPDTQQVAISKGNIITIGQLKQSVGFLRSQIAQQQEQRYGLHVNNSYEFLVIFLALMQEAREIIILPNAQQNFIAEIQSELDVLVSDHVTASIIPTYVFSQDGNLNEKEMRAMEWVSKSDSRVALFTSGSTGRPKKICKVLTQLDAEIQVLESVFGKQQEDTVVRATVSHQHIYGLLFRLLWPLCSGRHIDMETYPYPEPLMVQIQAAKTSLISSPAHLKRMPGLVDLSLIKHNVSTVFSSGGPLAPDVSALWREQTGLQIIEVFGSSETGGVAYRSPTEETSTAYWRPLPGVEIKIPESGVLTIRSPFEGSGDWVEMGDQASLQENDTFSLNGRTDRIVKLEEKRLSLVEVETVLMQLPLISEARALVLTGKRQQLAIAVVLSNEGQQALDKQGKHALNTQLRQHLSGYFEPVLLPRRWRYVTALPINPQGKLVLSDLVALFERTPVTQAIVLKSHQHDNSITLTLQIPTTLLYFQGHFDEKPILPGVVQINWAIEFAQQFFDLKPTLITQLEVLKFHAFIEPNDTTTLTLTYAPSTGKLSFLYHSNDKKFSSGRVVWT